MLNRLSMAVAVFSLLAGCAASGGGGASRAYLAKPAEPPPIAYCFDNIGHRAGAKPYILGGSCVCTPTHRQYKRWLREGTVKGLSYEELLNRYKAKKIHTALDHQHCNNSCPWGPHVLRGGHCMVPPTPGTPNYEMILSGRFPKPVSTDKEGAKKQTK